MKMYRVLVRVTTCHVQNSVFHLTTDLGFSFRDVSQVEKELKTLVSDGSIWLLGHSGLLQSHLEMRYPSMILFDFSKNDWLIGLDNSIL